MQIHELNNFTGTLGSGAYLAVDDGNDTGKLSTQQLLSATEARIDNIIAGPAPSAEEIVDARLGADGVTYPSLGDAIRDQVSDLKSDFNAYLIDNTDAFSVSWNATNGYIKLADGGVATASSCKRTDFLALPKNAIGLYFSRPVSDNVNHPNLIAAVAFYTSNSVDGYMSANALPMLNGASSSGYKNTFVNIPSGAKYIRLSTRNGIESSFFMKVLLATGEILKLDSNYHQGLSSNTDLNSITTAGNYQVNTTAIANSLVNAPCNTKGELFVFGVMNGTEQLFVDEYQNRYVRQYDYNASSWTKWVLIQTTEEMAYTMGLQEIPMRKNVYVDVTSDPISFSYTTSSGFDGIIIPCSADDEFLIHGIGGASDSVLWTFTDVSGNILAKSEANKGTQGHYMMVVAPTDTAYLIVNTTHASTRHVFKRLYSANGFIEAPLFADDFEMGAFNSSNEPISRRSLIRNKEYVPEYVTGFFIKDPDVTVYVHDWEKDGTPAGYRALNGLSFYFFNRTYNQKMVLKYTSNVTDEPIFDVDEILSKVVVYQDKSMLIDMQKKQNHDFSFLQKRFNGLAATARILMKDNYNIAYANSPTPMELTNYVGDSQNVHPKVLYFADGLFGHKYWMAYTPCGYSYASVENPCVAYSEDGYTWQNIVDNPLATNGGGSGYGTGYNSDPHLVYRSDLDRLECWYRFVSDYNTNPVIESLRRRTTTDGVTWTDEEIMYTNSSGEYAKMLSPSIIWNGSKYCMWAINGDDSPIGVDYLESDDGETWTFIRKIVLGYVDGNGIRYTPWHGDVIVDNGLYIMCMMCRYNAGVNSKWIIFLTTSSDNVNWSTPEVIIYGNPDGWDKYMYRPTIVKVGEVYRIYYSACDQTSSAGLGGLTIYGIGITESDSLSEFVGMF